MKRTLIVALIAVAVFISIKTLGPIIGQKFTPSIHILDPIMASNLGLLLVISTLTQAGLLILVINSTCGNLEATLLGLGAGLLIILPIATTDLENIIKEAMNTQSYTLVTAETKGKESPLTQKLIVGRKEILVSTKIATELSKHFPIIKK